MDRWETVTTMADFADLDIIKGPVPEYDESECIEALHRCEENLCKSYGTNWGCMPGAKRDVKEFYSQYSYVLVTRSEFDIPYTDRELLSQATEALHRKLRILVRELRNNGVDCVAFAQGGCKYCGECAYPEACRFPEMKLESASTLGFDIGRYLKSLGIEFSFSDSKVTLYCFVFVK